MLRQATPLAVLTACAFVSSISPTASAQWRCDCTTIIDSCEAEFTVLDEGLDIRTNRDECTRVDYFVNGMPFVAVIVDGQQRQDLIVATEDADIILNSCRVCLDAVDEPAADSASARDAESAADQITAPLIQIAPEYPVEAQVEGIEGYVDLRFTVDAAGAVSDIEVERANPAGIFETSAIAAVNRWRYEEIPGKPAQPTTARLQFDLIDYIFGLQPNISGPGNAAQAVATGPRNQCIREESAFNFGEATEIGLINACAEPLLVYGCVQAAGRDQGLWSCMHSEGRQKLLINANDSLAREPLTLSTEMGEIRFRYEQSIYLERAPNSEFWWLACSPRDNACRLGAAEWTRALNRQLATIDPQTRTSLRLARSY